MPTSSATQPMPTATAPAMGVGFASFAEAGMWFGETCGVMGCHNNRYPPSLSNSDLGVLQFSLTEYAIERCGGLPLVTPGDVDMSALPMVVTGACMNLWMPFGCFEQTEPPCLPEAEVERLRAWVGSAEPFR